MDRQQFLFWGGGHATSHENDVAHYSLRGNCWTIGYHPDDPIEKVYASQPTPVSFHDRAHVPIHAYKAYCYDPTAQRMFYFDRAYNPVVRDWEATPLAGLKHLGPMHSHMESTPHGAVTYSDQGLFRFDVESSRWQKLPWDGPSFGAIWCDGHCLCYDSRRDCLWLANDKAIVRYDMATGKAEQLDVEKPEAIGQWMLWSEQVYLPDADLILLMRLFEEKDGTLSNVVWNPATHEYYWVTLPFFENGKTVKFDSTPFSWSDALAYDSRLNLVLLNNSSARKSGACVLTKAQRSCASSIDPSHDWLVPIRPVTVNQTLDPLVNNVREFCVNQIALGSRQVAFGFRPTERDSESLSPYAATTSHLRSRARVSEEGIARRYAQSCTSSHEVETRPVQKQNRGSA